MPEYTLAEAATIWVTDLKESVKWHTTMREFINATNPKWQRINSGFIGEITVPASLACVCGNRDYWRPLDEPDCWRCSKCFPKPKKVNHKVDGQAYRIYPGEGASKEVS